MPSHVELNFLELFIQLNLKLIHRIILAHFSILTILLALFKKSLRANYVKENSYNTYNANKPWNLKNKSNITRKWIIQDSRNHEI